MWLIDYRETGKKKGFLPEKIEHKAPANAGSFAPNLLEQPCPCLITEFVFPEVAVEEPFTVVVSPMRDYVYNRVYHLALFGKW